MPSLSVRNLRIILLVSTATTTLSSLPALAQDAVRLDTIYLDSGDGTGLGLDRPADSATRLGTRVQDVPASVDRVESNAMRIRGQHNLSDAITRTATGVTSVTSPALGTAYALRGFQGNSSVMQVYDGTRLFPGRGNLTFPYDSWLAESVEVLRGAGSVIHGSGAIGGTIDVRRKAPFEGVPATVVTGLLGSNQRFRAGVDSGGSLGDRLSYRIAVVGDTGDGWIDGTRNRSAAGTASLAWQARDDLKFTLSADYARQEPMPYMGTPLRDGRIVSGTEHLNYNVDDAKNRFSDHWVQLRSEWTPSDAVSVTATLYGIGSTRDFRNAETYLWNPAGDAVTVDEFRAIRQKQDQTGLRTEVAYDHTVGGLNSRTVTGFDVNHATSSYADYSSYGAVIVDPFDPDPGSFPAGATLTPRYRSTLDQRSVFAENRTELGADVALNIGLRYDWFDLDRDDLTGAAGDFSSSYSAPSARVGLTWNPDADTTVYGHLAWATDPVNLPLLDYSASMADFKMTTGRQIEVGVKQIALDGRAEWSIAAFDIIKRNVLVVDPFAWTVAQAGRQSSRGIEVASSLKLSDTFRLQGNAAFTRARFDDFTSIDWTTFEVVDYSGKVPLLVPEVSANLWASWDFAPDWTAHAGVQYVGKSFYDYANTQERDAFTLVNVGVDWKPAPDTVLAMRVTNLFDKTYAAYLRTDPDTGAAQAILGEPRRFELQLTKKF